ncbi:hypothetical protein [Caenispirillum salinarum]|uniref:hypothetical protein n=1 Tax=Caenispirillum salinarum TaxID=859058 RepID=UPI00384A6340
MHQVAIALHVLSVAAWTGGLFLLLVVLRPALLAVEPAERMTLWARILPRAFTVSWVSAALALVTGFGLTFSLYGGFAVAGMHVHLMAGLGLLMTGVLIWTYFRPLKRFELAEESADVPGAERALGAVLAWQWVTLAMGAAALVIGGVGAYIGF